MTQELKIVLPGGAGLVGQNLVARLKDAGHKDIVVLDKHRKNLEILKNVQPDITVQYADLAAPGDWAKHLVETHSCVAWFSRIVRFCSIRRPS
jgi:nucleoside-diphosphate-sugar epimerase